MSDMSMTSFERSEPANIAEYLSAQGLLSQGEGKFEEMKIDTNMPARWVWGWPF